MFSHTIRKRLGQNWTSVFRTCNLYLKPPLTIHVLGLCCPKSINLWHFEDLLVSLLWYSEACVAYGKSVHLWSLHVSFSDTRNGSVCGLRRLQELAVFSLQGSESGFVPRSCLSTRKENANIDKSAWCVYYNEPLNLGVRFYCVSWYYELRCWLSISNLWYNVLLKSLNASRKEVLLVACVYLMR